MPLSREALRKEAVAYLRALPNLFSGWFDTNFPTFQQYFFHMEQDGSYGDDLVVTAISRLMLRPVFVCTDAPEGSCADSIVKFYPPHSIDPSAWGQPVIEALFLRGRHYMATGPVQ